MRSAVPSGEPRRPEPDGGGGEGERGDGLPPVRAANLTLLHGILLPQSCLQPNEGMSADL